MRYNYFTEEWETTLSERYSDTKLFAGESAANEEFRHWAENYDVEFISTEDDLHEVESFLNLSQERLRELRKRINSGDKANKSSLQEEHRQMTKAIWQATEQKDRLELRIQRMTGVFNDDPTPRKKDFKEVWEEEDPGSYTSIFHWRWAHDLAVEKELLLKSFLRKSTEEQDKRVIKRLDYLKKRYQVSSWWYHRLSSMVCEKHADEEKLSEFRAASKKEKRSLRRKPEFFWPAVADRLENFRRACEKNNESWGPTQMPPPKDREVALDPEINYGANRLGLTEDALIAVLDRR